jgi:FkbM family methyltransferase
MNEGQNISYYLSKGCRVVAVEAAPPLCEGVRKRFAADIDRGDLKVVNAGISNEKGSLDFYFNTVSTFRSSFRRPGDFDDKWTILDVPTVRLSEVLREHGSPYFLKIDIERYDRLALLDLLQSGIIPPRLSVEVHRIDVLCTLIAMGYTEFQLVNGSDIGRSITHRQIHRIDGSQIDHYFPRHSAGPFGDDLDGSWLPAPHVLGEWLNWHRPERRGWMDAHAQTPDRRGIRSESSSMAHSEAEWSSPSRQRSDSA